MQVQARAKRIGRWVGLLAGRLVGLLAVYVGIYFLIDRVYLSEDLTTTEPFFSNTGALLLSLYICLAIAGLVIAALGIGFLVTKYLPMPRTDIST